MLLDPLYIVLIILLVHRHFKLILLELMSDHLLVVCFHLLGALGQLPLRLRALL